MGTGARAERMALGASIAEKKSYLETLKAEAEDVSSIFETQQGRIKTLVDVIAADKGQPAFVEQPGEPERKIDFKIPVIIGIIAYFFLTGKK